MPVIACPRCGTQLNAPEELLGQEVLCGQCKTKFIAGAPPAAEPPPDPAAGLAPSPASFEAPPASAAGDGPTATAPPAAAPPPITPPLPAPVTAQPQPQKSSGYATASLVLGIASMPVCFCLGVPSIVCGILAIIFQKNALRDIQAGTVSPASAGMAKAGRICGIIGIFLGIGYWVLYIGTIVLSISHG